MSYFVKNVTENDVVAIEKRLIQTNDMIIHKKKRHHFQQVFIKNFFKNNLKIFGV
jgi:hypothetical protein